MPRSGKSTLAKHIAAVAVEGGVAAERLSISVDREAAAQVTVPPGTPAWLEAYEVMLAYRVHSARVHGIEVLIMDRGLVDSVAWAQALLSPEVAKAHAARNAARREAIDYRPFTVRISGVSPRMSIDRHEAAGVHEPVDDVGMDHAVLTDLFQAYVALPAPHYRMSSTMDAAALREHARQIVALALGHAPK